jgi:hypothetical protein
MTCSTAYYLDDIFTHVADFRGVSRNSELGWIVDTRNCKIPNLNIWDAEALPYLVRKPVFSGNCAAYNWSSLHGQVRVAACNFNSVSISNRITNHSLLAGSGNACGEHGKGWTSI